MSQKSIKSFIGVEILSRPNFSSDLGLFSETYRKSWLRSNFVQDSISISKKIGTLRGMHLQQGNFCQAKLITVLKGSIQDIFIDLRKGSATFCDYGSLEVSDINNKAIFLPKGFAHGFITLEENTIVSYKLDQYYSQEKEITIKWNDPDLGISWPKGLDYISSPKDLLGLSLEEYLLINEFSI